jgi:hypothetical protein
MDHWIVTQHECWCPLLQSVHKDSLLLYGSDDRVARRWRVVDGTVALAPSGGLGLADDGLGEDVEEGNAGVGEADGGDKVVGAEAACAIGV